MKRKRWMGAMLLVVLLSLVYMSAASSETVLDALRKSLVGETCKE